jgi:MscS family membrane protein
MKTRLWLWLVFLVAGWMIWGAVLASDSVAATNTTGAPAEPGTRPGSQGFLSFGLDRLEGLGHTVLGNPLWQYIASLIYLLLAFYVSKTLDLLIRVWLRRWAEKTETKFDDYLIELVHGPIKVVTFVILLHIGLRVFTWPDWFNVYLSKALTIVVAASITYVGLKFVDLLMNYWRDRTSDSDQALRAQIHPVLRKTFKVFIVGVAVLVTSQNLGINITGILASFSVGALAVGLAAQDTLANLFGAVAIYLDHPFKIGDRIKLDGVDGTVETIGLRSTRVRNLDGFLVTIPNKTVGNATITNVAERPTIKTTITVGLTYDTTTAQLKRAIDILNGIFKSHPMTEDVWITFQEFGVSALNIQVVHWWKNSDHRAYLQGLQAFNLAIKDQFAKAGLAMAYPTQTVYLKSDANSPAGPGQDNPPDRPLS